MSVAVVVQLAGALCFLLFYLPRNVDHFLLQLPPLLIRHCPSPSLPLPGMSSRSPPPSPLHPHSIFLTAAFPLDDSFSPSLFLIASQPPVVPSQRLGGYSDIALERPGPLSSGRQGVCGIAFPALTAYPVLLLSILVFNNDSGTAPHDVHSLLPDSSAAARPFFSPLLSFLPLAVFLPPLNFSPPASLQHTARSSITIVVSVKLSSAKSV